MAQIEVVKILAEGSNKRYMWYKTPYGEKCAFIDNKTYKWLKDMGVLTSQKIRAIKEFSKKLQEEIK